jgi:A/G-specific adenine glycosylase
MARSKHRRAGVDWVEDVRRKLAEWYDGGHRDFPWRSNRDPYKILVSESMLVQTTVSAVVPYFERFLARFPTIEALAKADEGEVLKAWEGLGYYRRARQLHAAARAVMERHRGVIPDDPEAIRDLPGVGRYIAGAILSFAFDRPAPIVEANTQRVLARLIAWEDDLKTSASQRRLWELAEELVPEHGAGRFNQAIMELGGTLCSPRAPRCLLCPLTVECKSRAGGRQDALPIKSAKAAMKPVSESATVVIRNDRVLVVQRGAGQLWEGFWEFPTIHVSGADPACRAFAEPVGVAEGLFRLTGLRGSIVPTGKTIRFGVTQHRVALTVYLALDCHGELVPGPGLTQAVWELPEKLSEYTFGSAMRKLANWVLAEGLDALAASTTQDA